VSSIIADIFLAFIRGREAQKNNASVCFSLRWVLVLFVSAQRIFACCTPTTRTSLSSTYVVTSSPMASAHRMVSVTWPSSLALRASRTSEDAAWTTTCVTMVTTASPASLLRPALMLAA